MVINCGEKRGRGGYWDSHCI